MTSLDREVVLKVDFDLLRDDGHLSVSLRFHRGPPIPDAGDTVYLLDGHGNGCMGKIVRREGWYVLVRPDWTTWIGDELPANAEHERS